MSTADIVTGFDSAFRDFASDGIPASGKHKVKKSDVRNLGATIADAIDDVVTGYVVDYETRPQLYSDLEHPDDSLARVFGDSNEAYRGVYKKSGGSGSGSWSRIGPLPEGDTSALEAQVDALDGDVTDLEDEVSDARGSAPSLSGRLTGIDGSLAASTTPVVDFGRELRYDENGAVGPGKTLYVPRELFARIGGSTALNGNFGAASTPFPDHVAFTISSGSDIATIYVDTDDNVSPVKIAQVPSGVVQNVSARYLIIAEIWRGVVKSPFPVLRIDENLKSRVQMRFPIAVLPSKIRIPSFYHYTRRTGFVQYSPADGFYWEFDLPSATNSETRYYFDPTDAVNPVKAVSSTDYPTFPRDDVLVMIASAIGRTVKTDHPIVGARPGSREISMFSRGNDPDKAALFSASSVLTDVSAAELTALGIVRGVTGLEAFYGEDLPADMPLEGWYFVRCYVEGEVADTFYTPRLYFLDAGGNALTTEGGSNSYFSLTKEMQLSSYAAVYVGFARYKFTSRPVRFNIGAYQSLGPMTIFAGAQLYAGENVGGYVFPEEWPTPSDMDVLYGAEHFSIEGRTIPFFVPSMLASKRNAFPAPRLTIRRAAASDGAVPYFLSGGGTLELDYARAGSSMLFETQGGPEGATRRARRTVASLRVSTPVGGAASILAIGDSITNREVLGKLSAKLTASGVTPTFLGTIQQNDGVMGEGRESWEWQDFYYGDTQFPAVTDVPAYLALAADGTGADRRQGHNPWVRPATGGDPAGKVFNGHIFDFAWGLSRLGLATPTHVPINLGTNDVNQRAPAISLAQAKKGLEIFVPSIRAAGADINIGVGMPVIPRSAGSDQKWVEEQVPMIRAILQYISDLGDAKVKVLPLWAHMSADTDWSETSLYTEEYSTVARISDELHPGTQNRHMMAEVIAAWVANTL